MYCTTGPEIFNMLNAARGFHYFFSIFLFFFIENLYQKPAKNKEKGTKTEKHSSF